VFTIESPSSAQEMPVLASPHNCDVKDRPTLASLSQAPNITISPYGRLSAAGAHQPANPYDKNHPLCRREWHGSKIRLPKSTRKTTPSNWLQVALSVSTI